MPNWVAPVSLPACVKETTVPESGALGLSPPRGYRPELLDPPEPSSVSALGASGPRSPGPRPLDPCRGLISAPPLPQLSPHVPRLVAQSRLGLPHPCERCPRPRPWSHPPDLCSAVFLFLFSLISRDASAGSELVSIRTVQPSVSCPIPRAACLPLSSTAFSSWISLSEHRSDPSAHFHLPRRQPLLRPDLLRVPAPAPSPTPARALTGRSGLRGTPGPGL